MSHAENKMSWCLKKAEDELAIGKTHRGLIKIIPNLEKANAHLVKAEHYLNATDYLKKGNFSDISMSTIFYSMYHSLLAIAAKFGFESRNQECTFALISSLIEEGKISIEQSLINKIYQFKSEEENQTSMEIREQYQYGTSLSLKDEKLYPTLILLAKEVLAKTKFIIEVK
jgi:uncharacterized protein (UPF0332 family)